MYNILFNFIKEQKIDTDNSGTINKAELAQLLSAAKANGIDMGDVVDFSMPPINPRIDPDANLEGMEELANTVIELNEAKEQDRAEFDEQIKLVYKKLDVTPKKIEKDGQMVVAKPVQINGEWKVQLSQVNGISTYDDIDNYPAFFIKE